MTLEIAAAETAATEQINDYNSHGPLVRQAIYSPPAGTEWAMIGLVLADAAVTDDESTLVSDIEALAGISSVANPRFWGQMPASILVGVTHEGKLVSEAVLTCKTGFPSNQFDIQKRLFGIVKPPVNKKWMVVNCVLPGAFADQAAVTAIETALEGITGITTAKLLLTDNVPSLATNISLTVTTRMRIDEVEI